MTLKLIIVTKKQREKERGREREREIEESMIEGAIL